MLIPFGNYFESSDMHIQTQNGNTATLHGRVCILLCLRGDGVAAGLFPMPLTPGLPDQTAVAQLDTANNHLFKQKQLSPGPPPLRTLSGLSSLDGLASHR